MVLLGNSKICKNNNCTVVWIDNIISFALLSAFWLEKNWFILAEVKRLLRKSTGRSHSHWWILKMRDTAPKETQQRMFSVRIYFFFINFPQLSKKVVSLKGKYYERDKMEVKTLHTYQNPTNACGQSWLPAILPPFKNAVPLFFGMYMIFLVRYPYYHIIHTFFVLSLNRIESGQLYSSLAHLHFAAAAYT